jgi:hypothetical protein
MSSLATWALYVRPGRSTARIGKCVEATGANILVAMACLHIKTFQKQVSSQFLVALNPDLDGTPQALEVHTNVKSN